MLNLIEHLWQLEISNCKIVPTVIKVSHESPKLYFYSEKQRRVLRKKQHTAKNCISFLKEKYISGYFLALKIASQKRISPSLILLNQVQALIQKDQTKAIVLGIELDQQLQNIYLCECNFGYKIFQLKMLMHKKQEAWSCSQKEITITTRKRIIDQVVKICNNLLLNLKVKQPCQEFNMILGTNELSKDIFWLWCNNFEWKGQSFYQIKYKWLQNDITLETTPAEKTALVESQKIKESSSMKEERLVNHSSFYQYKSQGKEKQLQFQNSSSQKCRGCDRLTDKNTAKQVTFDEIISLKRKNKLSIMGINEQYGIVCNKCYFLLEQINDL